MNRVQCPIAGCTGGDRASGTFPDVSAIIRHLGGDDHARSLHLVDLAVCQEVGIFTCTRDDCPASPKVFFKTAAQLARHEEEHHPLPHHPTHISTSHPTTSTTTPTPQRHNIPFIHQPTASNTATTPTANPTISTCESCFIQTNHTPAQPHSWAAAVSFISANLRHDPPDFRSTWRPLLNNTTKIKYQQLMADTITSVVASSRHSDHRSPPPPPRNQSRLSSGGYSSTWKC